MKKTVKIRLLKCVKNPLTRQAPDAGKSNTRNKGEKDTDTQTGGKIAGGQERTKDPEKRKRQDGKKRPEKPLI